MTAWRSLYLPYADNVAETLEATLTALGYQRYDPFGLIPGKAYAQAVRLFIAPANGSWTRLIGDLDRALLPALSQLAPCLLLELEDADAHIEAYAQGAPAPLDATFTPYASALDCIAQAMQQTASGEGSAALGGIALDSLPNDVQALAQKVDLKQANKMFARLSGNLAQRDTSFRASGGSPSDLLRQPDWNSAAGMRIRALLDCLNIPNGREPDFVTLRDAYALHERRRRSPNAKLYPGDAETLAAVPDALAYTPIYAGKNP